MLLCLCLRATLNNYRARNFCECQLEHQYNLVINGEEPTIRLSALDLLIERVRARGMRSLADKTEAAVSVYLSQSRPKRATLKSVAQMINPTGVGRVVQEVIRGRQNVGFHRLESIEPLDTSIMETPRTLRSRFSEFQTPKAIGYIPSPALNDKGKGKALLQQDDRDWQMSR